MTRALTPNILIGHCALISRFSDFALYLDTQLVYFHTSFRVSEYDLTFDCNKLIGHCDIISRFSDFALYLDTELVYFHTSFRLRVSMTLPLTPIIL